MTGTSQYYRNIQTMKKCQANYDAMQPPEYWEDDEEVIDDEEPDFEAMLENKRGRE